MPVPTVYLVDSNKEDLATISGLLASNAVSIKEYPSAEKFFSELLDRPLGCIVTELDLTGMSGFDLLAELQKRGWDTPTVVLTNRTKIADCSRAFRSGATDYFLKRSHPTLLLERVREHLQLDADSSEKSRNLAELLVKVTELTRREREIVSLLLAGKSMKQIAQDEDCTFQAVSRHRTKALEKLGFENEIRLLNWVMENNVTNLFGDSQIKSE